MATLADALQRYNLTGPGAREASLAMMPFASLLRLGQSRSATERSFLKSDSIPSILIRARAIITDMVKSLTQINDEKDKQRIISDRIQRIEAENRLEAGLPEQFKNQEGEENKPEDTSILAGILASLGQLIRNMIRRIFQVTRSVTQAIRSVVDFSRRLAVRAIPGVGLLASAIGAFRAIDAVREGRPASEGFREGRESVFGTFENYLFGGTAETQRQRETNEAGQERPEGRENLPIGDFQTELNNVSSRLGINPNDLLTVMAAESELGRLSPDEAARNRNPRSSATGLIQFMESTARGLGTTTAELGRMTAAQQMQYVERYFRSVGLPRGADAATIYAYVFLPGRARSPDGVLTRRGESYYNANPNLDANGDGVITISDLNVVLGRVSPRAYRIETEQRRVETTSPAASPAPAPPASQSSPAPAPPAPAPPASQSSPAPAPPAPPPPAPTAEPPRQQHSLNTPGSPNVEQPLGQNRQIASVNPNPGNLQIQPVVIYVENVGVA